MLIPHRLIFGDDFYQDAEEIRIKKSSLPRLDPSSNNSAQSLLVGLILQSSSVFQGSLENEAGEPLLLDNGSPLEFDNSALYHSLNVSSWRRFFQEKKGIPIMTNTFLIEFYASPLISYNQPITPDDL